MKIPKSIKIGKTKYVVEQPHMMDDLCVVGRIHYSGTIQVAQCGNYKPKGRKQSKDSRTVTFWHEVMHGILHDMGHKLYNNEVFVDAVAQRIAQVIKTARFE